MASSPLATVVLLLLGLMVMLVSAETYPYSIAKQRVGPFNLGFGTMSFNIPLAPFPAEARAIKYWGDWVVRDGNDAVVPVGKVFLHHIMLNGIVSGSGILVTGSSDERATFGPNLKDNFVMPTAGTTVSGSVFLLGFLPTTTELWIEYTVHYYTQEQMPPNPINVLSSACTISVEVPQLGPGHIFNQTASWTMPVDGYLVTGVAHLHVGGVAVRLIETTTGKQVCYSPASHFTPAEHLCVTECPNSCSSGLAQYAALKSIQHCDIYKWYPAGTTFTMDVAYDASCSFSGCHGHLYMWYAPASMPVAIN